MTINSSLFILFLSYLFHYVISTFIFFENHLVLIVLPFADSEITTKTLPGSFSTFIFLFLIFSNSVSSFCFFLSIHLKFLYFFVVLMEEQDYLSANLVYIHRIFFSIRHFTDHHIGITIPFFISYWFLWCITNIVNSHKISF